MSTFREQIDSDIRNAMYIAQCGSAYQEGRADGARAALQLLVTHLRAALADQDVRDPEDLVSRLGLAEEVWR